MEEKKKVVLKPVEYTCESFHLLADSLHEYGFTQGGAHTGINDIKSDSFWAYCYFMNKSFTKDSMCKDCKCNVIMIGIPMDIPSVFYDWQAPTFCSSLSADQRGKIFVNGKFAGIYCKKRRFFFVTDWTHHEKCVQVAKMVLEKMREMGLLTKKVGKKRIVKFPGAKVTIGSDPEFELNDGWDRYKPVPQRMFSTDGKNFPPYGNIGADGAGSQIEFRPAPSRNVIEHVDRIKKLIEVLDQPLAVRGDRYPLGCHIHFGIPGEARGFIRTFVGVLDDFLGRSLIDLSGDARGDYKRLGAYETKAWGFEYRSLPSAVLASRETAKVVFKIAKNVLEKLLREGMIEYDDPPSLEDYKRICRLTEKEIEVFRKLADEEIEIPKVVNAFWVRRKVSVVPTVNLYDDWKLEVRKIVEEFFLRKKFRKAIIIEIFGLRKERGIVVAGYKSQYADTIDHDYVVKEEGRVKVGWPWSWRMGEIGEEELTKRLEELYNILKGGLKCV